MNAESSADLVALIVPLLSSKAHTSVSVCFQNPDSDANTTRVLTNSPVIEKEELFPIVTCCYTVNHIKKMSLEAIKQHIRDRLAARCSHQLFQREHIAVVRQLCKKTKEAKQ